jgi:GntR family transcriptional regulator
MVTPLRHGPVPLHHQVYLDLRAALAANRWRAGDQLPPERELAEAYGCSLITVRRALDELVREGRLERTRGRGTFVLGRPLPRDLAGQVAFSDEMRSFGLEAYAAVVTARDEPASPPVADALGIPAGQPVWYLERIRGANGVPLLLEQVRLPAARLPGLLEHDFTTESLWDVLESGYGLPVESCREVLSAVVPTERETKLLQLHGRTPSIQLDGIAFTAGHEPIEQSRTLVSPERGRYFVESPGVRMRSVAPK